MRDPEGFWAEAAQELHWFKPWDKVLDWNLPWAKWFVGGKINLCYNCVDRHVDRPRRTRPRSSGKASRARFARSLFAELHAEVQKFANALKSLGIQKGDRVAVYMGMTPELAIALLACARIGAVHSVIFGGFAANAIADRVNDCAVRRHSHPGLELPPRQRSPAQGAPWMKRCRRAPQSRM